MGDWAQIIDTVFKIHSYIQVTFALIFSCFFFYIFIKHGRKVEKVFTIYVMTFDRIVIKLVVNRPVLLFVDSAIDTVLLRPR